MIAQPGPGRHKSAGTVRYIKAGPVRLAFRTWHAGRVPGAGAAPGAMAAPPLVLLHALGGESSDWDPVARDLVASWRVHAPDLRGHGASDWTGPYTVEQLTADLEAFLDALGLRRVAIAGHSLGATPAYLFAARHPERVTRLVLEEPVPPFPRPPRPAQRPEGELHFDWDVTALSEEFTDPPSSWRDALSDIKVPALMIADGPDGHAGAGRLSEMAALIPGCEMIVLPRATGPGPLPGEAGPGVHAARPAEFTAAVAGFLNASAS